MNARAKGQGSTAEGIPRHSKGPEQVTLGAKRNANSRKQACTQRPDNRESQRVPIPNLGNWGARSSGNAPEVLVHIDDGQAMLASGHGAPYEQETAVVVVLHRRGLILYIRQDRSRLIRCESQLNAQGSSLRHTNRKASVRRQVCPQRRATRTHQ